MSRLRGTQERAWKPNFLVPVEDASELLGTYRLLHAIAAPKGSIKLMGIDTGDGREELSTQLDQIGQDFGAEGVFTTVGLVEADEYASGLIAAMGALETAFFRPNVAFLTMPGDEERATALQRIVDEAPGYGLGVVLFADHPKASLGRRQVVNVWLRAPEWETARRLGELDLALLVAYKLMVNWRGRIRVLTVVENEGGKEEGLEDLRELVRLARLPAAETYVLVGRFEEAVSRAPRGDVDVFGLAGELDIPRIHRLVERTGSACLFVRGAGDESITA